MLIILFQQVNFIFFTSEVQNNPDLALLLEAWVGIEGQMIKLTLGLLIVVVVWLNWILTDLVLFYMKISTSVSLHCHNV